MRNQKKRTEKSHTKFCEARDEANKLKRAAKEEYYKKMNDKLSNPDTSSKNYWKLMKQLYGNKTHQGIPPLIKDGHVFTSPKTKCNIFNETLLFG